jgi:hypothetical protein
MRFVCDEWRQKYFIELIQSVGGTTATEGTADDVFMQNTHVLGSTVWNTEQLTRSSVLANLLREHKDYQTTIWDYSLENMDILAQHNISAVYKPYVTPAWEIAMLKDLLQPVYDVAFVGAMSTRRYTILKELMDRGLSVRIIQDFGLERDKQIGQCRVLLNIHYSEEYKIFESVRCNRWMAAGLLVVTEEGLGQKLDDPPNAVPYKDLVSTVLDRLSLPHDSDRPDVNNAAQN